MKRLVFAVAIVTVLSACSDTFLSSSGDAVYEDARSSVSARDKDGSGRYVIVLDSSAAKSGTSVQGLAAEYEFTMDRTYRAVLRGGAAQLTPEQVERLERDSRLALVVPDQPVWTTGEQFNPPWGLDRIDQRQGLDSTYTYNRTASEVDVYVIDSGIYAGHQDFGGRVSGGVTFVGSTTGDCDGHGTHVAGTVGGTTYGVAKGVRLVPVRVFGCDGTGYNSDVIAALDWVAQNADGPSVVNMSLGSDDYAPVNEAVRDVTSAGIPVVVSAGNDACDYSPASEPTAITVAAADASDTYASFSNYGNCVDLFAPGVDVTSAYIGSSTAEASMNGTSMASPHVAGVAALLLADQPGLTAEKVHEIIVEEATQHVVYDNLTANNHMLFSLMDGAALQVDMSQYWKYRSVELVWIGFEEDEVVIYQNGASLGATPNDGTTSITLGWEATGTYRFRICTSDESICTPEESVTL